MINSVDEKGVPYWEEYAYVVNMDTRKLEMYIGDNRVASYEFLPVNKLPNWRMGDNNE